MVRLFKMLGRGSFLLIFSLLAIALIVGAQELTLQRENKLTYGKVIYITSINVTPAETEPGSESEVNIRIENIGESKLRDVIVRLNLPAQFSPSIGDVVEKKIRNLGGYEQQTIGFRVSALPDSTSGIYSFPINVRYINEIGDTVEENNTMSMEIGAKPELLLKISESTVNQQNMAGTVTISFVNRGLSNIKFLTVEMLGSSDFSLTSSDKDYLGDIASDDFEEAEFNIKLNQNKEMILIPMKVDYRDANNQIYSQNFELELRLPSAEEVKNINDYYVFGLVAIVIVIIAYIVFKRVRKSD